MAKTDGFTMFKGNKPGERRSSMKMLNENQERNLGIHNHSNNRSAFE